jgi:hypothetical protein
MKKRENVNMEVNLKLAGNLELYSIFNLVALLPREENDLTEIGWDCIDWIDLAQDRDKWRDLVNTVMNLRVPQKSGNWRLLRRPQLHG